MVSCAPSLSGLVALWPHSPQVHLGMPGVREMVPLGLGDAAVARLCIALSEPVVLGHQELCLGDGTWPQQP